MINNKILFFLDELYYSVQNSKEKKYVSTSAAGSFFNEISFIEKSFMFPVSSNLNSYSNFSTIIEHTKIYPLPEWTSVISYLRFYLKSAKNRNNLKRIFKNAINENDIFWLRVPSVPALLFAKMLLKTEKKILLHHAGEIGNAWKNNKYKSFEKIFAFFMSKYMFFKIKYISKNQNVINLCTGSALTKQFKKYNSNTYYFIDSLIKKNELVNKECPTKINNFIYVGRLTEDKGIKELLSVFKKIISKHSNAKLVIIGFGPEENYIREYISLNKLDKNIKLVGYVPNSQIKVYYQTADILILPSKAPYEGFPRVIIEAWANGLNVISTRIGGVEGLGVDKKNILFCQKDSEESLQNTIEKIISDKNLFNKMHNYIQNNREKITKEYYQDLLKKLLVK